jgi:hypothetical protein
MWKSEADQRDKDRIITIINDLDAGTSATRDAHLAEIADLVSSTLRAERIQRLSESDHALVIEKRAQPPKVQLIDIKATLDEYAREVALWRSGITLALSGALTDEDRRGFWGRVGFDWEYHLHLAKWNRLSDDERRAQEQAFNRLIASQSPPVVSPMTFAFNMASNPPALMSEYILLQYVA